MNTNIKMGRKDRNKIKREVDPEKELQNQQDEELLKIAHEEDMSEIEQRTINNRFEIIWNMRRDMLEYCDTNALPLCDYLTSDIFEQFVEYMTEK